MSAAKKRIVIQFCVTAKEKRDIKHAAKRAGKSMTAFILQAANGQARLLKRWELDPRA